MTLSDLAQQFHQFQIAAQFRFLKIGVAFSPVAENTTPDSTCPGVSDLKGDTRFHAFLWTRRPVKCRTSARFPGMLTAPASASTTGVSISLDASGNLHPFLWQKGVMTNLNTLVPADSPLYLLFAHSINSRGEIVGFGVAKSTGDVHAFLAIPSDRDHDADKKDDADDHSRTH